MAKLSGRHGTVYTTMPFTMTSVTLTRARNSNAQSLEAKFSSTLAVFALVEVLAKLVSFYILLMLNQAI
jgi:hypothetical protein